MKTLTPEEAVAALDAIESGEPEIVYGIPARDSEDAHIAADAVLLAAVDESVAAAYKRVKARVGAWWYA